MSKHTLAGKQASEKQEWYCPGCGGLMELTGSITVRELQAQRDDLLASCKEMVEVNKHLLRVLYNGGGVEQLDEKHNGCGVRAQEAIARAEGD